MEEALRIALLATITALAVEDADRRLAVARAELAASPSEETADRVGIALYSRRVIEEHDRLLEISLAETESRDETVYERHRNVRERRLAALTESDREAP